MEIGRLVGQALQLELEDGVLLQPHLVGVRGVGAGVRVRVGGGVIRGGFGGRAEVSARVRVRARGVLVPARLILLLRHLVQPVVNVEPARVLPRQYARRRCV